MALKKKHENTYFKDLSEVVSHHVNMQITDVSNPLSDEGCLKFSDMFTEMVSEFDRLP